MPKRFPMPQKGSSSGAGNGGSGDKGPITGAALRALADTCEAAVNEWRAAADTLDRLAERVSEHAAGSAWQERSKALARAMSSAVTMALALQKFVTRHSAD